MIAYAAWAVEAILSLLGAHYAYRRRITPLWIYLGFRALADLVCFLILISCGWTAYAKADYIQRLGQYTLFSILSMFICAKIVNADKHTRKFYCVVAALGSIGAAFYFHYRPLTLPTALAFEVGAHIICGTILAAALFFEEGSQPWKGIALGMLTIASSDAALAFAQAHHWKVEQWYPVGAILGLGVVLWAAKRKQEEKREELAALRLSLVPNVEEEAVETLRFGPQSVGWVEAERMQVN